MIRAFHHSDFPLEPLRERKRENITVVLSARKVAAMIAPIVKCLQGPVERPPFASLHAHA